MGNIKSYLCAIGRKNIITEEDEEVRGGVVVHCKYYHFNPDIFSGEFTPFCSRYFPENKVCRVRIAREAESRLVK